MSYTPHTPDDVARMLARIGASSVGDLFDSVPESLRSRGEVDVEKIARQHGGGGHRNAAGFALEGSGEEIRRRVVELLAAALSDSGEAAGPDESAPQA